MARDTGCELDKANMMSLALFPSRQIHGRVEKPFVHSLRERLAIQTHAIRLSAVFGDMAFLYWTFH